MLQEKKKQYRKRLLKSYYKKIPYIESAMQQVTCKRNPVQIKLSDTKTCLLF